MIVRKYGVAAIVVVLCGCSSGNIQKRIIGSWRTDLAGFPIVYHYSDQTVGIKNHEPIDYLIDDNVITFNFEGKQSKSVSFESKDTMVQKDLVTGVEQRFERVTVAE